MRYCPGCRAEVEDTGGFCLLGHDLALQLATSSLSELRGEVDRAFEEAKVEVTAAMSAAPPLPQAAPEPVPARAAAAPPAPPPRRGVFEELEVEHGGPHDPISAFAPPPRMDWGPEERLLRRRPRGAA